MGWLDELAWAAGLFDGEGTVQRPGCKSRGGMLAAIQMTECDVLERFRRAVGLGRVYGPVAPKKSHWKPLWQWRVTSLADVRETRARLAPWLSASKQDAFDKAIVRFTDRQSLRVGS